ncbi:4-hydroxy-3-methylbut-2-enyl diphosphate reductase [bacterium]|nr:4-hydroxy-3-methylbut-2-enyl diphosphate reductase [bacterium]
MKIIISKKLGFCFGVKRSIEIAQKALKGDELPVNFLGYIVHNEKVIDKFKKRGVNFISSLDEMNGGTLITKAHGVSKKILDEGKKRNLNIKITTCPIVRKAQKKAEELYRDNYQVIIIGEKEHPETKVIKECAGKKAIITEDETEINNLPFYEKLGVIAQTTKKREKVERLLKLLEKKCKKLKWLDTICNEVSERQRELREILKEVEGVIVVGSKKSANTTRLAEITEKNNKKLFWVDSLEEIKVEEIKKLNSIGLVSGTSAPDWEIEKIKNFLKTIENEKN